MLSLAGLKFTLVSWPKFGLKTNASVPPLPLSIPLAELPNVLLWSEAASFQPSKPDLASVVGACRPCAAFVPTSLSPSMTLAQGAFPCPSWAVSRMCWIWSENDCAMLFMSDLKFVTVSWRKVALSVALVSLQLQHRGGGGVLVHLDAAAGAADVILQRVVEQRQPGAVAGRQQRAVAGQLAGIEVLDDVVRPHRRLERAVDIEAAEVVAVDGGVLQLQHRGGGGVLVDLDAAAGAADVILQRVVEQRQPGAVAGRQQRAVAGQLAGIEVLDEVVRPHRRLERAVDIEAAEVVAVDGGVLQFQHRGGGGVLVHLDAAAGAADVILQRVIEQRQPGAVAGRQQRAVAGQLAGIEVPPV